MSTRHRRGPRRQPRVAGVDDEEDDDDDDVDLRRAVEGAATLNPAILLLSTSKLKMYLRRHFADLVPASTSNRALERVVAKLDDRHQEAHELMQPIPSRRRDKHYRLTGPIYSFQLDVMFMNKHKRANHGYDKALVVVDQLSRKAWVVPIKTRSLEEGILPAYKTFEREIAPIVPVLVKGDDEFNARAFKDYLESQGTVLKTVVAANEHITKNAGNPLGIADRFIRTLRGLLSKEMIARQSGKWTEMLHDVLHVYNDLQPHGSLPDHKTPSEVFADSDDLIELRIRDLLYNYGLSQTDKSGSAFPVGSWVRIVKRCGPFAKASMETTVSTKKYQIQSFYRNRYHLVDPPGSRP